MGDKTGIQWTDATWNPTAGCSRVSPGCENCYAERFSGRFAGPGQRYEGLVRLGKNGARWTGELRLNAANLDAPLRWKRPRRIFVNSMSDLFHPKLTNDAIAAVFGVMGVSPQHTFQILTKHPDRMREWFAWLAGQPDGAARCLFNANELIEQDPPQRFQEESIGRWSDTWPLPNVWLGVSVENQDYADKRIPDLLATPAAVRFVSYEPALGPVNFARWLARYCGCGLQNDACDGWKEGRCPSEPARLSWLIVGGESGPHARPFDVAWARSTIAQCKAAGIAAFCKQLGANIRDVNDGRLAPNAEEDEVVGAWPESVTWDDDAVEFDPDGVRGGYQGEPVRMRLKDRKGGDMSEWPADLRVRDFPRTLP